MPEAELARIASEAQSAARLHVLPKRSDPLQEALARLENRRGMSAEEIAKAQEQQAAERIAAKAKGLIDAAGLPERAKHFTRAGYELPAPVQTGLREKLGTGVLAALLGQRGTGKTCIAAGLVREAASRGMSALYVTAMDIFLSVRETFGEKATLTERKAIEVFLAPRLLIIDEMQERGETKWEDRLLTHLIDKRYGALNKDTILIANLQVRELIATLGPSIASRLSEAGGIIECKWGSFRGKACLREANVGGELQSRAKETL